MLISESVVIKPNHKVKKHYTEKGYVFEVGEELEIKTKDLTSGSHVLVDVRCDYCGEIVRKQWKAYLSQKKICVNDCCKKCSATKSKESMIEAYGVDNCMHLDWVKQKMKDGFLDKYGVEFYSQTEQRKDKIKLFWENASEDFLINKAEKTKNTNLDKYGVEWYTQTEEYNLKTKKTCMERYGSEQYLSSETARKKYRDYFLENYGVDNYFKTKKFKDYMIEFNLSQYGVEYTSQREDVKEKTKKTNISRYGAEWYTQTEEYRIRNMETWSKKTKEEISEIISKRNQTLLDNGNGKLSVSKQQLEIFELLKLNEYDVELEYPFSRMRFDIYLVIDGVKIDIEYDGSFWHKKNTDRRRDEFTKSNGIKVLRIKSGHKIPTLEQLEESIRKLTYNTYMYDEIILEDWRNNNE